MTFQRENRYIVIKIKDLAPGQEADIMEHLTELSAQPVDGLVIESDWPEYEPVWQMIQARMEGATPPAAQVQGEQPEVVGQLALDEPFSGTEGLEIGEWEFVPERSAVESMLAVSTGEMVPLMTVAQHERVVADLKANLAMAMDAAAKGDVARQQCGGMEMEIAELRAALSAAQVQGEREGFEVYAKSKGWDGHHFNRAADDPERYDDWGVQPEWLAFKAGAAWRAALSAPPVSVPAELTNVRCMCGDEYPHDSYGAGFIAGSGMCENCDAAIPAKEPPAAGVPEGYVLAPIKPTIEMVEAGYEASLGQPDRSAHARVIEQYDAMLAEAPPPPASEQQQAVEAPEPFMFVKLHAGDVMDWTQDPSLAEYWAEEGDTVAELYSGYDLRLNPHLQTAAPSQGE